MFIGLISVKSVTTIVCCDQYCSRVESSIRISETKNWTVNKSLTSNYMFLMLLVSFISYWQYYHKPHLLISWFLFIQISGIGKKSALLFRTCKQIKVNLKAVYNKTKFINFWKKINSYKYGYYLCFVICVLCFALMGHRRFAYWVIVSTAHGCWSYFEIIR